MWSHPRWTIFRVFVITWHWTIGLKLAAMVYKSLCMWLTMMCNYLAHQMQVPVMTRCNESRSSETGIRGWKKLTRIMPKVTQKLKLLKWEALVVVLAVVQCPLTSMKARSRARTSPLDTHLWKPSHENRRHEVVQGPPNMLSTRIVVIRTHSWSRNVLQQLRIDVVKQRNQLRRTSWNEIRIGMIQWSK